MAQEVRVEAAGYPHSLRVVVKLDVARPRSGHLSVPPFPSARIHAFGPEPLYGTRMWPAYLRGIKAAESKRSRIRIADTLPSQGRPRRPSHCLSSLDNAVQH